MNRPESVNTAMITNTFRAAENEKLRDQNDRWREMALDVDAKITDAMAGW